MIQKRLNLSIYYFELLVYFVAKFHEYLGTLELDSGMDLDPKIAHLQSVLNLVVEVMVGIIVSFHLLFHFANLLLTQLL